MSTNRWFAILIVALLVVAVLTLQAGFATAQLVGAAPAVAVCQRPAINLSSVHGTVDSTLGMIVARSDAGPTGVDGGLLSLLMEYRTCAK